MIEFKTERTHPIGLNQAKRHPPARKISQCGGTDEAISPAVRVEEKGGILASANEDGEARRRTYRDGKAEQGEEEPVPVRLSFLRGRGVGGRELQS